MGPSAPYEIHGDVNKVVFPNGWVHDPVTDVLSLYYGAGDTVVALATATLADVLAHVGPRPSRTTGVRPPRAGRGVTISHRRIWAGTSHPDDHGSVAAHPAHAAHRCSPATLVHPRRRFTDAGLCLSDVTAAGPGRPVETPMRIGFIGLGRMGANMVRRRLRDGHEIVAYNRTPEKTRDFAKEGAEAAFFAELVAKLAEAARGLGHGPGRRCDGGPDRGAPRAPRARRHDHRRRQHQLPRRRPPPETLAAKGIGYVDAGTGGGWGLQVGYALMVGGEDALPSRWSRSSSARA